MAQSHALRWCVYAADQGCQNYLTKGHKHYCGLYVISVFRRKVNKKSSLLGYYAASSGNLLPTFRENLPTPSSGVDMEPIGCPETSVRNCNHSLRTNLEERSSHLLWVDSRAARVKITASYLHYHPN